MNVISFKFLEGNPTDAFIAKIDTQGFFFVGVPKDKVSQACKSNEIPSQGIYFLVNLKESKYEKRYLYVGQTKTGPHRLIDHKQKKSDWDFAFMFLGPKSIISLQLVDELEALEIKKYKNNEAFRFVNEKPNAADIGIEAISIANIIENVMIFLGYGAIDSKNIYLENKNSEVKSSKQLVSIKNKKIYYVNTKESMKGKKIIDAALNSNTLNIKSFRELLTKVALYCFDLDSKSFINLANKKTGVGKKARRPIISCDENDLRSPIKIANDVYIEANSNSDTILRTLEIIMTACNVSINQLVFSVE